MGRWYFISIGFKRPENNINLDSVEWNNDTQRGEKKYWEWLDRK